MSSKPNPEGVTFTKVSPDAREHPITVLKYSDINRCPHLIIWPEHYRADGTCKCNDPQDPDMPTWGYAWDADKNLWVNASAD